MFSTTSMMLHQYHHLSLAVLRCQRFPCHANPSSNRPPYLSIDCPLSASLLHLPPPTISLVSLYFHLQKSLCLKSPDSISTKIHLYPIGIRNFRKNMLRKKHTVQGHLIMKHTPKKSITTVASLLVEKAGKGFEINLQGHS